MLIAPLASAFAVRRSVAELIRPPRRLRPSEAAQQSLRTDKGPWDPTVSPMMIEPMDMLASREYQGIVFVGAARSSKTMSLVLGGMTYIVTCAPGDTLVSHMTQDTARDFSRTDLDRSLRHSPDLAERLSPRARDDNTYDKFFRSGMMLKIGWPAVSQLSAKTLKYVMLTDYDRPANRDNVDGEGPYWDLAFKRIQTYMSRGKCVAESSPGEDFRDPQWKARTKHEAPPARGILSLYNRGTRARWYWPCQHCGHFFQSQPGLGNFPMPEFEELEKSVLTSDLMSLAAELAHVVCPDCGASHDMENRVAMNAGGHWIHDGQSIDRLGRMRGKRRSSQIASYWLGGAASTYQRWDSLVLRYLQALQAYVRTGTEDELRATTNTDQGAPYLPRSIAKRRSADELMKRAEAEDWPQGLVPATVRFIVATVDVQSHRFVVQMFGFGVGLEGWLVDRYEITASKRPEGERFAAIDPSAYVEDWDLLIDEVVEKTYKVDGLNCQIKPHLTLCDSGGKAGVTERAYEAWRRFRRRGLANHFRLVKGDGRVNAPRVQETWPDVRGRKARAANARGDVPVLLVNTNVLKDAVAGDLARDVPGPGYMHLPKWLDAGVFEELTAETRGVKGWERQKGVPNEAFDLHVYARAGCIQLGAEKINWAKPPAWALPLADQKTTKETPKPSTLADLAAQLNG
jgi:phage terminase large subunit GpA-like protein